jgi:glycosyltransferase involved in cell wall biosynthesis
MSGHSFEAMNQGRALCELTGYKHHELTYHPDLYDKSTNYNDSPSLLSKAAKYLYIHRVKSGGQKNVKVFDGELTKAFTGRLINLIQNKKINVISTFYLDPHAFIANQAKLYAQNILGRKVLTVHKAVGSDILNSIGNHLKDGQAKFLLQQFQEADLMFAVSQYTKDKLVEYAKIVLPPEFANRIASRTEVLYAPFDNEYFSIRDEKLIRNLKERLKIKPDQQIISYFGRIFPEKGIDDLIEAFKLIKEDFPKLTLVIGGYGMELPRLKKKVTVLGLKDVRFTGAVSDKEKRAVMQMSVLGVIPTKPIKNFVETLCISALEYQASGTVLLTTKVGGVPEAGGSHSLYAKHSDPRDLAAKIALFLNKKVDRDFIIRQGLKHVAKFNYRQITKRFLEKVCEKREEKKVIKPVRINPDFWLKAGMLKSYGGY